MKFAGFETENLLFNSTPAQHGQFLTTVAPQRAFDELTKLWAVLMFRSRNGGFAAGGIVTWSQPDKVVDTFVRGQGFPEGWSQSIPMPLRILTIASQPVGAGFRLASWRQIDQWAEDEKRRKEAEKNKGRLLGSGYAGSDHVFDSVVSEMKSKASFR